GRGESGGRGPAGRTAPPRGGAVFFGPACGGGFRSASRPRRAGPAALKPGVDAGEARPARGLSPPPPESPRKLPLLPLSSREDDVMSKVLIIGAGGVGQVVAHKVSQNPGVFSSAVLASRTKSKCDAIAAQIAKRRDYPLETAQVDADNPRE